MTQPPFDTDVILQKKKKQINVVTPADGRLAALIVSSRCEDREEAQHALPDEE